MNETQEDIENELRKQLQDRGIAYDVFEHLWSTGQTVFAIEGLAFAVGPLWINNRSKRVCHAIIFNRQGVAEQLRAAYEGGWVACFHAAASFEAETPVEAITKLIDRLVDPKPIPNLDLTSEAVLKAHGFVLGEAPKRTLN